MLLFRLHYKLDICIGYNQKKLIFKWLQYSIYVVNNIILHVKYLPIIISNLTLIDTYTTMTSKTNSIIILFYPLILSGFKMYS